MRTLVLASSRRPPLEAGRGGSVFVTTSLPGSPVPALFWFYLAPPAAPLRSLTDMKLRPAAAFGPVFHELLDGGIYLAPSAFEVGFLSAAHSTAQVDALAKAMLAATAGSQAP